MPRPVRLNKTLTRLAAYSLALLLLLGLYYHRALPGTAVEPSQPYIPYESIDEVITGITLRTCSVFSSCSPGPEWRLIPKRLDWRKDTGKAWSWSTRQYLYIKAVPLTDITDRDAVTKLEVRPDGAVVHEIQKFDPNRSNRFYYGLDVIFGSPIDPRYEWKVEKTPISGINGNLPVFLTLKNTPGFTQTARPVLEASDDNKFKVLQVADLHFSSFDGICRDQYPEIPDCKADARTLAFLNKVLDIEQPDLVVLTGDQIFGEDSFDSITTTLKFVQPLIQRRIPYAVMFGNHDDEGSMSRQELMTFMKTLPFNLATEGPQDVDGVGNYVLRVFGKNEGHPINFFILDSHKYSQAPKVNPGYDWLKESQIDFIKKNTAVGSPQPINMAFFHIPLPEYRNLHQGYVGNYKEAITAPKYNTGARDALQAAGVSVVSVGHDHCNDFCMLDTKEVQNEDRIWLCFGGAAGEGGYGGYGGTTRRLRVFDFDTKGGVVKTYKRLETEPEKIFDEQILVSGAKAFKLD